MFSVHKIGPAIEGLVKRGETEAHKILEEVLPHAITVVKDVEEFSATPVGQQVERLLGLPDHVQGAVAAALDKLLTEFEHMEGIGAPAPADQPAGGQAAQPVDPPSVQAQG